MILLLQEHWELQLATPRHKNRELQTGNNVLSTLIGALVGAIAPDSGFPEKFSGTNSYPAIMKQMITKRINGTARHITWPTAGKMGAGLLVPGLPGNLAEAAASRGNGGGDCQCSGN